MQIETLDTYQKIASLYAGPETGEDDPSWRESCRKRFIQSLSGKQVLEIGCGPAIDGHKLSELGFDVTVSDASSAFLDIVNARFPHLKTHQMDYLKPDLPPTSFDGIIGMATFLHVPHSETVAALAALQKMLKPGGTLFLTLLKSELVREYVIDNFGGAGGGKVWFYCHSQNEVESWSHRAGFERVDFFEIPSELYDTLPRLKEKDVRQYQAMFKVSKKN